MADQPNRGDRKRKLVSNADQIRRHLGDVIQEPPPADEPPRVPDLDQTIRAYQLGLEVQRHQMQRSLTHAGVAAALSLPLFTVDRLGVTGAWITVLLAGSVAIQVWDTLRALGYYNLGVDRLNPLLRRRELLRRIQQFQAQAAEAEAEGDVGEAIALAQTALSEAETALRELVAQEQAETHSESRLWFDALAGPHPIEWPSLEGTTSMSTRSARSS